MSEHVLDQPDDAVTPAVLLRTGFSAAPDRSDGTPLIGLSGELDLATAPALAEVVAAALEDQPASLALDLSQLTFVDSTGISVLINAHRRAEGDGCRLVLRSPQRAVLRALQLTGVDQILTVEVEHP